MPELVGSLTAALYAALSAFAVSIQALAPVMPWHASVALSGVAAAVVALSAWAFTRIFRRR
jgi:hypothetical protein